MAQLPDIDHWWTTHVILSALVRQLGGAVSLTPSELDNAQSIVLNSTIHQDPFRLLLRIEE